MDKKKLTSLTEFVGKNEEKYRWIRREGTPKGIFFVSSLVSYLHIALFSTIYCVKLILMHEKFLFKSYWLQSQVHLGGHYGNPFRIEGLIYYDNL